MMKQWLATAAAVLAFGVLGSSGAQEGHPLKGSWLGEWAGNTAHGDDILLILDWDGKAITGMINPGTDNIPLSKASLEPNGWVVKIDAEGKD
jgi:membrane-associated protease RseP (regulator of RpoE activity)